MAFGQLSLKGRALRYLSQREHSRAELQRKLLPFAKATGGGAQSQTHDDASADAEANTDTDTDTDTDTNTNTNTNTNAEAALQAVLSELTQLGLLSDERVAAAMLLHKGHRLGPRRLRQHLVNKGLAPELVSDTVAQALADELPRAREVWLRRFRRWGGCAVATSTATATATTTAQTAAERAKQMRFLLGRGFSADVANRVVREGSPVGFDDDGDEITTKAGSE